MSLFMSFYYNNMTMRDKNNFIVTTRMTHLSSVQLCSYQLVVAFQTLVLQPGWLPSGG